MTAKLTKLDILEYALEGAVTRRGVVSGLMTEAEEDQLDKDIAELERRIAAEKAKEARNGT